MTSEREGSVGDVASSHEESSEREEFSGDRGGEERQEIWWRKMENSPHGSVTGEGPSAINTPSRPQATGRVRTAERTPSRFFNRQEIPNFPQPESEASHCRELSEG